MLESLSSDSVIDHIKYLSKSCNLHIISLCSMKMLLEHCARLSRTRTSTLSFLNCDPFQILNCFSVSMETVTITLIEYRDKKLPKQTWIVFGQMNRMQGQLFGTAECKYRYTAMVC